MAASRKRKRGTPARRRHNRRTRRTVRKRGPRGRTGKPVYHFDRMETVVASNARSVDLRSGTQSSGPANSGQFELSQVQNYTEFSQLFDQYRLDKVVLSMVWGNQQPVAREITNNDPTLSTLNFTTADADAITAYFVRDHDDNIQLTESQLRERQDISMFSMKRGKMYKKTIIPAMRSVKWSSPPTITGGNPTLAVGRSFNQWIPFRMATSDGIEANGAVVPSYGYKVLFRHLDAGVPGAVDATPQGTVQITARYYFSCKTVS